MTTLTTACKNTIEINADTVAHLVAHPEAGELLEEAIAMINLPEGTFLMTTVEFDRVIGTNACLPAENTKVLHFSVRSGRDVPTRVLVGQTPEPTKLFTILAFKGKDEWVLITGFVGPQAPREPHDAYFADKRDSDEFRKALEFWTSHGLCIGNDWGDIFVSTWDKVIADVDAKRAETAQV